MVTERYHLRLSHIFSNSSAGRQCLAKAVLQPFATKLLCSTGSERTSLTILGSCWRRAGGEVFKRGAHSTGYITGHETSIFRVKGLLDNSDPEHEVHWKTEPRHNHRFLSPSTTPYHQAANKRQLFLNHQGSITLYAID